MYVSRLNIMHLISYRNMSFFSLYRVFSGTIGLCCRRFSCTRWTIFCVLEQKSHIGLPLFRVWHHFFRVNALPLISIRSAQSRVLVFAFLFCMRWDIWSINLHLLENSMVEVIYLLLVLVCGLRDIIRLVLESGNCPETLVFNHHLLDFHLLHATVISWHTRATSTANCTLRYIYSSLVVRTLAHFCDWILLS